MRKVTKRSLKVAVPALAAASFAVTMGAPAAHGDFIVSFKNVTGASTALAGYTDYVVRALNNNGPLGTGSTIIDFDVVITTSGSGTTGAMYVDLAADIDGDASGAGGAQDANVIGAPDDYYGTATPTFGGTALNGLGTFLGIPKTTAATSVSSPTGTGYTILGVNPSPYTTSVGTLDPNYTNGTLHSLEVSAGFISATFKGPVASVTPVPFANIVVPNGTVVTVAGGLGGNLGSPESFTVSNVQTGPTISLSGTAPSGSNLIASPVMSGQNGLYVPQTFPVPAGQARQKGYLSTTGFNPNNDEEIYGLAVTDTSSESLSQVVSDLNSAVLPAGASVVLVSSLTGVTESTLAGDGDNVAVIFPQGTGGAGSSTNYFAYDVSNYNGSVTISSITVVPEPTGIGALVLGGIGLMSRRRGRRVAAAV
jgi:hypothetical protein